MSTNKWTFKQLEGHPLKILTLEGYAAPFGRPRKDPVLKETIKSRVQTTRYPGSSASPTRHAFGVDWDDTELKGRWATKHLPVGVSASDMADQWTEFVRDERTTEMSWGNIVSYQVFIQEVELSRESEDDIAWKMKILVDKRTNNVTHVAASKSETSFVDNAEAALQTIISLASLKVPTDLADGLDFFDSLNLLIGELNSFPAALNKLVNQVGSIETATFGALNSLRTGIVNIQTTVIAARELITTTGLDASTFARSAKSDLELSRWASTFDVSSDVLLDILADLDRKAEIGAGGNVSKVVTATSDDTWESLSTRAIGGPDHAGQIRTANGGRYGDRPVPGNVYVVP